MDEKTNRFKLKDFQRKLRIENALLERFRKREKKLWNEIKHLKQIENLLTVRQVCQ